VQVSVDGGDAPSELTLEWSRSETRSDDDESTAIDWASTRPSLREYLRSQLACTQAGPRDRALVDLLIETMDGATSSDIITVLFELEMAGLVRRVPGNNFLRVWAD
jgi:predicted Rossmann fold nucleotide-binding protein DprA/Smf involved in DNA uptake